LNADKISVCIIGAGSAAGYHAKAYNKNSKVELLAVSGREKNKLAEFCRRFNIKKYYTNYHEMLCIENPSSVSVCTPTHTHYKIVLDVLEYGCDILCEKPMSSTIKEADLMLKAAEKSGKIFLVGYVLRFFNQFMKVKEIVESGILGELKNIWYRKGRWLPEQEWYLNQDLRGSGALGELGTHGIDLIRWLANSEVNSVIADLSDSVYEKGINDNAWVCLRLMNGVTGVVGSSFSYPFFDSDFAVCGNRKAIRVSKGKVFMEDLYEKHSLVSNFFKYCKASVTFPYRFALENPFGKEIDHFVKCTQGECQPLITADNGRKNLKIVLAAFESSRQGKRVIID
jgi:UDP-N-acetylglucosamine 3-dehydrogenase